MRTPDDNSVPDLTIGPLIRATHQDPWKNVGAQASKGRLVFHPAAAQSAAQECADVMGTVGALRQAISNMGRLSELSHLGSGWYLANQINGTTNTVVSVMDSFRTVLGEMLDTFKRAGRNYLDSDDLSAAEFPGPARQAMRAALDDIRPPTAPGKFFRQPPNEGREPATFSKGSNTEITTVGARDLTVAGGAGQKSGTPIEASELVRPANVNDSMLYFDESNQGKPESLRQETLEGGGGTENPYSQLWRDLYDLGVSTQKAVKPVYHQAEMWKWVAGELGKAVEGLADRLTRMPESLWDGAGAAAAKAAVQDYHSRARDFTVRMESFGGNLDYTSRWLKNTAKGMPDTPDPPERYYDPGQSYAHYNPYDGSGGLTGGAASTRAATEAEIARQLAIHRQNMENNYVVGVQNSSEYLPAFGELPSTARAPGDTPPHATVPDGSTTVPSSPGTTVPAGSGGIVPTGSAPSAVGGSRPGGALDVPAGGAPGPGARGGYSPVESAAARTPTGAAPRTPGPAAASTDRAGQLSDLAKQGLQNAGSAADEALKQASQPGSIPRMPATPGMPQANGLRSGGLPSGGGISGGTGAGGSSPAAPPLRSSPALFPRASLEGMSAAARAVGALGSSTPMNGAPGAPAQGAGNQGQQDKEHEQAKYLRSKKHLDQALGEGLTFTRSVVE
ncbi:hypothetical protein [Nocardia carnea]|uniref:hypothetical protein n=2 Tax=Nocardia carnea TaxID=37328 RepID=UPI002456BC75|nr:hypothetical protein [Nocardia carnea]